MYLKYFRKGKPLAAYMIVTVAFLASIFYRQWVYTALIAWAYVFVAPLCTYLFDNYIKKSIDDQGGE